MALTPRESDPTTLASDEDLVRALASEGPQALGPIYDRHASLVFGLARAILRDPDEAEDLVQEVFLLLQRKGRFDPSRGTLATYLATMTRSRSLDRLRSRRRRSELLSELGRDAPDVTPEPSPLDRMADDEHAQRTREALARLPERHRRVLEMAYYEGLSQTEIAAALDTPLGTVKTWARMGLKSLRESLKDLIGRER